jgi:hypothetical protein
MAKGSAFLSVRQAQFAYEHGRKAPRTRKAGSEFADPDYDLSVDWLAARDKIREAARRHVEASGPAILLINCSSRSEHTCPGEMSKSYRLVDIARAVFAAAPDSVVQVLDLSRLASEYGRNIHPCNFERGCERLILGSGQVGNVHLSPEAEAYFAKKGCNVILQATPEAIRVFNTSHAKKIGLFHVTC